MKAEPQRFRKIDDWIDWAHLRGGLSPKMAMWIYYSTFTNLTSAASIQGFIGKRQAKTAGGAETRRLSSKESKEEDFYRSSK
ncbi:hypothetical protein GCWU000246_01694 [Jonquetella anthropi E3_33 E1]|nr:hypothetical protein GCWU000246_01694 [Jonquetella anthropi E3_33 E1]